MSTGTLEETRIAPRELGEAADNAVRAARLALALYRMLAHGTPAAAVAWEVFEFASRNAEALFQLCGYSDQPEYE